MAGTDGGGASMDYEYDAQSMPGSHTDPMRTGGRISRCPALAHSSWNPFPSGHYHGAPGRSGWQQGSYNTNHLAAYSPSQNMAFGYSAHLPARGPSLPNPLPEPRGSLSSRPQETAVPAAPATYNPTRYAGVALPDPSPPAATASSPGTTSASPDSIADPQVSPSSSLTPPHTRGQPISVAEPSVLSAYPSPSPLPSAAASQSRSTTFGPAQRDAQSSSVRPPPSQSMARARLPAPGTRQRVPSNDQRLTMALGNYARYRDVANYLELAEYEATHAAASQTSDEDSDRDLGARPFGSVGHTYLQTARQSQILRGQMNNKRVASKKALQSLQKVDADSLPDNEKTCVICYNDFGVASPEGTVETPLRLPKCKHVFGNQCILKWLEESYSCPYCRDKLESEMARPDQDTIRRMLTNSDLANLPPSIRHRAYRTQTSDRAEARIEAHSLLRSRQRELEASRDSMSRGERRAAPSGDFSDAQRRQRPRFSTDSSTAGTTTTASTQNPSQSQHSPAWQQHGNILGNPWGMAPQYIGTGPPPASHLANYALPSFAMTNPGFPHDLNGPSFPPMFSREDFYYGSQHSDLAQMGFDVSRPGGAHEYTLPRPLHAFARHIHSPGDPSQYAAHQQNNQQTSPYQNMAQPVRSDGPSQGGGAYPGLPNRN